TPPAGGGATLVGIPYCCATVPRSGWRLAFWAMLLIQVPLWAWTGRAETSALKTLSAGNKEQLVPGRGSAWTGSAWDGVSASSPRTSETPHVPLGRISLSTTRAAAQVAGQDSGVGGSGSWQGRATDRRRPARRRRPRTGSPSRRSGSPGRG